MILGIWVANANPAAEYQTEAGFRAAVVELAEALGYLVYYVADSRRCAPGYPDLSLLHPGQGRFLVGPGDAGAKGVAGGAAPGGRGGVSVAAQRLAADRSDTEGERMTAERIQELRERLEQKKVLGLYTSRELLAEVAQAQARIKELEEQLLVAHIINAGEYDQLKSEWELIKPMLAEHGVQPDDKTPVEVLLEVVGLQKRQLAADRASAQGEVIE